MKFEETDIYSDDNRNEKFDIVGLWENIYSTSTIMYNYNGRFIFRLNYLKGCHRLVSVTGTYRYMNNKIAMAVDSVYLKIGGYYFGMGDSNCYFDEDWILKDYLISGIKQDSTTEIKMPIKILASDSIKIKNVFYRVSHNPQYEYTPHIDYGDEEVSMHRLSHKNIIEKDISGLWQWDDGILSDNYGDCFAFYPNGSFEYYPTRYISWYNLFYIYGKYRIKGDSLLTKVEGSFERFENFYFVPNSWSEDRELFTIDEKRPLNDDFHIRLTNLPSPSPEWTSWSIDKIDTTSNAIKIGNRIYFFIKRYSGKKFYKVM